MIRRIYIILSCAAMLGSCAATGTMQSLRMAEYLYQQGDTQQLDNIISVLLEDTDDSRDA
ncbi:hypothetical protein IIB79_13165, partial [candidate division KSB1 bacterium]|nr:hypothetical protein [candidate division KSB1 bacterium]